MLLRLRGVHETSASLGWEALGEGMDMWFLPWGTSLAVSFDKKETMLKQRVDI
jgi:hypothetical protein